jgi:acetolactate synthase-1/2/3 large subunit
MHCRGAERPFVRRSVRRVERIRTVHTRHEQGAAYMALGAALATGKPQATAVVPGPGLLNAGAALLTAYSMNAPVLRSLVKFRPGYRPQARHLHEIDDQLGILKRVVGHAQRVPGPEKASRLVADAFRAMASGRPGPAALECGINVWGRKGDVTPCEPLPSSSRDRRGRAARCRQAARRREESDDRGRRRRAGCLARSDALAEMLQAPVLCGFRRGQGVLDRAIRSPSRCRSAANCGAKPTWCSRSARGCSSSTRCGASTTTSRSSRSMPIRRAAQASQARGR